MVDPLLSAQGMIPGSWDRVSHWAPLEESASPSAYVSAFLSVSLMNKYIKSFYKKKEMNNPILYKSINIYDGGKISR